MFYWQLKCFQRLFLKRNTYKLESLVSFSSDAKRLWNHFFKSYFCHVKLPDLSFAHWTRNSIFYLTTVQELPVLSKKESSFTKKVVFHSYFGRVGLFKDIFYYVVYKIYIFRRSFHRLISFSVLDFLVETFWYVCFFKFRGFFFLALWIFVKQFSNQRGVQIKSDCGDGTMG